MEKVYVYSFRKNFQSSSMYVYRGRSVILYLLCIGLLVVSFFVLRSITAELREELIFQLSREREVLRINQNLKVELSGITKKRYLELKAQELGLKKPREEEVVVLR